jgi:hypothetical protein
LVPIALDGDELVLVFFGVLVPDELHAAAARRVTAEIATRLDRALGLIDL